MEYITTKENIKISRIGFGCCPLGGHGWGKTLESDLFDALHYTLDSGINFFDTADVYGLGLSEERLGKVLRSIRDKVVIASKFGVRFNQQNERYYDNTNLWLKEALHNSLKRLQTDYLDLYQIHYWDEKTPFEELIEGLEKLKTAGKIRNYGVTNIDVSQNRALLSSNNLLSFSYEYSLLKREHEPLIRSILLQKKSMLFLAWGSLAQGLLSGKYSNETKFDTDDRRSRPTYENFVNSNFEHNLQLISKFKEFQEEKYPDKTLTQLAIRWILDSIPSSIALIGIKKSDQVKEIMRCMNWTISNDDLKYLDKLFFKNICSLTQ